MAGKVFIISENSVEANKLGYMISDMGYGITGITGIEKEVISKLSEELPDIILLDIELENKDRLLVLTGEIGRKYEVPYLIVCDALVNETNIIEELRPVIWIQKPLSEENLKVALNTFFSENGETPKLRKEPKVLKLPDLAMEGPYIIGKSKQLLSSLSLADKVAKTDVTVLVCGETGTGKELFAKRIHETSNRQSKKMVKVNCAAIPKELLESELFGHEKGAFTGATGKRIGKFELADKGTIFLDEIGELPLDSQSKILRCLQEKEIEVVGGDYVKKVDTRIIAATNLNLKDEVDKGAFRADLYFRLNIFPVVVPPLRERKDDIEELAYFFLKRGCKKVRKDVSQITSSTLKELKNYDWPGNVRELEHVIDRGLIMCNSDILDVPLKELLYYDFDEEPKHLVGNTPFNLQSLEEVEKQRIILTLQYCNGKIRGEGGAAEILGIHPNTLDSKIKKLGILKTQLYKKI